MNAFLAVTILITVRLSDGRDINMSVERYLMGVLPAEMSYDADMDALIAQGVFCRTYAYCRLQHPRDSEFHIYSIGRRDQAYVPSKRHSRTDAAIRWSIGTIIKGDDPNCQHAQYNRQTQEEILSLAEEGLSWREILHTLGKEVVFVRTE
jgi:SpoIID/LytB domain protein